MRQGLAFGQLSQRVIYGLLFSFSDFYPIQATNVPEVDQRAWYQIMKDMAEHLYSDPSLLELPVYQDDGYEMEEYQKQRPELIKKYKEIWRQITLFYKFLFYAGVYGELIGVQLKIDKIILKENKIQVRPCYLHFLQLHGVECKEDKLYFLFCIPLQPSAADAWKLLGISTMPQIEEDKAYVINRKISNGVFQFACGAYQHDLSDWSRCVERENQLPDSFFTSPERCLTEKGFQKSVTAEFTPSAFQIQYLLKGEVSGLKILYSSHRREPFTISPLNAIGLKAMLSDFHNLPEYIQVYLKSICRICNHCNACTSKGTKSPYTVTVAYQGENLPMCPISPSAEKAVQDIVDMRDLTDFILLQEKYGVS